jgi:desulfoferrodoxin (superoxide reductase-like protein)
MVASLMCLLISATSAFADKASVTMSAPDSVKKGTEVTITIKVTHSGNNFIHHVDWATVSVDGKEAKRWEYSWTKTPESAVFVREFKYVVTAPVEITAEADCNMHGSKGPAKTRIKVTE